MCKFHIVYAACSKTLATGVFFLSFLSASGWHFSANLSVVIQWFCLHLCAKWNLIAYFFAVPCTLVFFNFRDFTDSII